MTAEEGEEDELKGKGGGEAVKWERGMRDAMWGLQGRMISRQDLSLEILMDKSFS